jgi:hypothetical protein
MKAAYLPARNRSCGVTLISDFGMRNSELTNNGKSDLLSRINANPQSAI